MSIKRGEIYYADLSPVVGSEQGGIRPVLIVQNDMGNRYSPTVIAAAITSQRDKAKLPTHIELNAHSCGLSKNSVVLLEQVRTLDKRRLKEKMGELPPEAMHSVDSALSISFGLGPRPGHGKEGQATYKSLPKTSSPILHAHFFPYYASSSRKSNPQEGAS